MSKDTSKRIDLYTEGWSNDNKKLTQRNRRLDSDDFHNSDNMKKLNSVNPCLMERIKGIMYETKLKLPLLN